MHNLYIEIDNFYLYNNSINRNTSHHFNKMNSPFEFASSLSNETKWHGNHNENSGNLVLKAGRLSMVYEYGNLRYISFGNSEVIRMIYAAVRDTEWQTIKPTISEEEFELHQDSFIIKYRCQYTSVDINFLAHFTIKGNHDNSLIISFEGEALKTFEKNRIGFCVLHPVKTCAGESCIISHSNDALETSEFPQIINPIQPFRDIKSMKWKIAYHNCTLDFYGDVFEMEDQRNWTDASYKTYCTPLNRPFPAKLRKGEKINQKIVLKVEGDFAPEKYDKEQLVITIHPEKILEIPSIGIGRSTRQEPLTKKDIQKSLVYIFVEMLAGPLRALYLHKKKSVFENYSSLNPVIKPIRSLIVKHEI